MQPLTGPADVVNRALQFVGGLNNFGAVTGTPPNFDNTQQGKAAGILYYGVVQTVMRQFGWDFARNYKTLSLTANSAPLGYLYEYLYPVDVVQLHQLLASATPVDFNNPAPVRWTVGNALGASTTAMGSIAFSSNPANGSMITLNGRVFTFVNAAPGAYQFLIGGNVGGTLALAVIALAGSPYTSDPALNVATYTETGGGATDTLVITYKTPGTAGNSYTLAAQAASHGTVSAATLTGGTVTQQKVIWSSVLNAQAVVTNSPPEPTWDALFTDAVVRLLGSELNLALASKPDSSDIVGRQSQELEQAGERRTDT